jgi:hypothetical protein
MNSCPILYAALKRSPAKIELDSIYGKILPILKHLKKEHQIDIFH